jgi:hypothetical protein
MKLASADHLSDQVTRTVMDQTEAFISCYLAANPKTIPPADANQPAEASIQPDKSAPQTAAAKFQYVGSKKSKVFHKSDCRWVGKITPENLVGYSSRENAIKTGKKPCKRCKP